MMSEYFATKYDSAAHEVIAILADISEGYGKEATGDVESPTGYVQLVHLDDTCDLDVQDTTGAYPLGDYAGEVARAYGVTADDIKGSWLVTSNSQGFVSCERFDTAEATTDAYRCAEARYDVWADEDRDEEDDIMVCPVIGHGYHHI